MPIEYESFPAISSSYCWRVAEKTHEGKVRKVNEDALMVNNSQAHWAVADGMGGHSRGDVASKLIVSQLSGLTQGDSFPDFIDEIEDRLLNVNTQLLDMTDSPNSVIGSTIVGLVLRENQAFFYWAGDSRLYLWREHSLSQVSVDHTVVQELLEAGKINETRARTHPEKNIITRAVGSDCQLYVEFSNLALQDGDIFLLCSDGLEKEVSDEELNQFISERQHDPQTAVNELLEEVLKRGARDNVTLVLVQVSKTKND